MHKFMISDMIRHRGIYGRRDNGPHLKRTKCLVTQQMALSHKQGELWIVGAKGTNEGLYKLTPATWVGYVSLDPSRILQSSCNLAAIVSWLVGRIMMRISQRSTAKCSTQFPVGKLA